MPNFIYIAKSIDGQTKTGVLNVKDEHELAQNLKREGLMLVKTTNQDEKISSKLNNLSLPFSRVSLTEKLLMVRNLGVMFSTGLSLVKSFEVLAGQTKNKKLQDALNNIREKINKGSNLSDAMADYPSIFNDLFVNMISVGEEAGTLDEIFNNLSLQYQKEHELKSKIKNAMTYPVIIVIVMIIVAIVMVTFVLPNLKIFFDTLTVDIPIYTRLLLDASDFFSVHWYLLILGPAGLAGIFYVIMKTKQGKKAVDTLLIRMPVIKGVVKKNNSALLIRSLSSLMASGVPLTRSLEISSKTINNHHFKEAVLSASEKIKKGEKLSNALRPYQNIFPYGVIEMMEVGEETGKTSSVLKKLADFYEQEAINAIEKLTILIEPMLIVVLGLGVGIFAFSIIQPMYSSLQGIAQN